MTGYRLRELGALGVLGLLLCTAGCGGGGSESASAGTEKALEAGKGGTVTASSGASLELSVGALPKNMTVSVAPVAPSSANRAFVGGVGFGPQGTILQGPAKASIPLPADWKGTDAVEIYDYQGNDPNEAMPSGTLAVVKGAPGAYVAEMDVYRFCGKVLSKNCHAGTIKYLLSVLAGRGCGRDLILKGVNERYPSMGINEADCAHSSQEHVQALLDTYFDDIEGWNPGQDVPADVLVRIAQYVREGRQVALAFSGGAWGSRSEPNKFFPSSAYAHTAVLELRQGTVQIRNTAEVPDGLSTILGGEAVAWYPVDRLNEFRQLQSGVALELQICGSPGCLSDPARNPYGRRLLGNMGPVDSMTNPGECNRTGAPCVPGRGVPWPSVRIYVEKPSSAVGCPEGPDSMSAVLTIDGYVTGETFSAKTVLAGLGTINNAGAYPTVFGSPSPRPASENLLLADQLSITMAMNIPGPGLYGLGGDLDMKTNRGVLVFTSPRFQHLDGSGPLVFYSTTGSLKLFTFGASIGSVLDGTFEADIAGEEWITRPGGAQELRRLTGHVSGSFDAAIKDL